MMKLVVEIITDGGKKELELDLTDAELTALRRANKEQRNDMIEIMVWNCKGDNNE